jgi:chemotaxis protein CheC
MDQEKISKLLGELGSIGSVNAANALSEMILQDITIEVPGVYMVDPIEVPEILQIHGLQTVVSIEQMSRDMEIDVILVFTVEEATKLAKLLMDAVGMDGIDEMDVLDEIGNIMLGNFINAFSDYTDVTLKPTPPTHLVDYFDAIISNCVTNLMYQDIQATLFDTKLKCGGTDIEGLILMFLNEEFQETILAKSEPKTIPNTERSRNYVNSIQ